MREKNTYFFCWFYSLRKRLKVTLAGLIRTITFGLHMYPVVAPIFQKGFVDALFSEREKDSRVLLLKISAKLIDKYSSLKEIPRSWSQID